MAERPFKLEAGRVITFFDGKEDVPWVNVGKEEAKPTEADKVAKFLVKCLNEAWERHERI